MNAPTFAEGQTVRVRNMRGVFVIKELRLVAGEVVLFGGQPTKPMTRYVTSDRLLPAKAGDVAPGTRR